MSSVEVEVNYDEVGTLLKSSDMQDMLQTAAEEIRARCGDGYVTKTKTMSTRVIATVETENKNYDAMRDNLENNTLLKALK